MPSFLVMGIGAGISLGTTVLPARGTTALPAPPAWESLGNNKVSSSFVMDHVWGCVDISINRFIPFFCSTIRFGYES